MPVGRPAKPTQLKLLAGNPGKRRLPENEPQPPKDLKPPGPPRYLKNKAARSEWRRISPLLHNLGLLTKIDQAALAAYCQTFARWQWAEEKLAELDDLVTTTDSGYPVQSAHLAIANKALELMHKFLVEFGLTPSSRTRVKAPPKPDIDDWSEF
jgi:P27 family predicted phage terminase small subunit